MVDLGAPISSVPAQREETDVVESKPLTANSSIGTWLQHPEGGPLMRELLAKGGFDESTLAPVRDLPLQQLIILSQGQLPQAVVDDLVARANGGVMPTDGEETGAWQEQITPGRFEGRTVIVTGAASGIGRATASRIAREGGRVIAVDISGDRLDEFGSSLPDTDVRDRCGQHHRPGGHRPHRGRRGVKDRRPGERRRHQ